MHRNRKSPEKHSEQPAANLASRLSEQRMNRVGWGMADGLGGWLADLLVSESHGCLFGRSFWSVLWLVVWLVG